MKISNSKKELASIISENGGWRDGAKWSVQHKTDGRVVFTRSKYKPEFNDGCWDGFGTFYGGFVTQKALPNWHQCILSREEYFHLYPAPDAKEEFCESATRSIPEPESKPTIEQLAADYRNRKDYADRKQEEADAAKADAEAKLAELVAAGKEIGLVLSVAATEPELVITDWRDVRCGDCVWVGDSGRSHNCPSGEYEVVEIDVRDTTQPFGVKWNDLVTWPQIHERGWRFIRRP